MGGVIALGGKADLESRGAEKFKEFDEDIDPALAEFEKNRREYISAMKRIRLENPDISLIELEAKAREEVVSKAPSPAPTTAPRPPGRWPVRKTQPRRSRS